MHQDDGSSIRQWYALRIKARQEDLVATLLGNAGIEVFLPREPARTDGPKPRLPGPLFPGYLFGRLAAQRAEIHLANYTPGVLYVVGSGDEPWPVPDELIHYLRQRLNRGQRLFGATNLRRGERLVITNGPLRGIEAVFDRHLSATGRVRILVQILKRTCPAEVQAWQVRSLGQTAGAAAR